MTEFDQLLDRFQHDPSNSTGLQISQLMETLNFHFFVFRNFRCLPPLNLDVREAIGKIMGAPGPMSFSSKVNTVRREKIVEVHEFMLRELKALVAQFQQFTNRDQYDMKTVTIGKCQCSLSRPEFYI